ncbi:chorismate-binding protein [Glycomyces salinus]|uniref:chorismate-binding protein n=1 Tax=Glycomyces salinus TaxID=980294 RepID=UPI0018EE2ADE|nr:chorismate-binding protein [Glycomyces salinus]
MSAFSSVRPVPPGAPGVCADRLVECDRFEWRLGQGGDPAVLVADFLDRWRGRHTGAEGSVCGVGVLISAAAGAAMIGGAAGAVTPVPAVPDVALVAYRHGRSRAAPVSGGFGAGPWRRSWTASDHAKAVSLVQEAIGRGDVYQACLVGHRQASWSGEAGAAAAAVRRIGGAAWGGVMSGDDWMVASASPECFLIAGEGRAATFPIKGTAAATEAGRAELLASVKERAEHVMIVDLERNDLARVAVPGSVTVEELFALRSWGRLWQAESTVSCVLAEAGDVAGLLRAMCPPGSVTGTPKLAVLDLVSGLEPVGRGPAMGAMGFWSGGVLRLGLTIRTVAFDGASVHVWAGGGITWRSVAADEVAEAEAKAAGVVEALGLVLAGSPDFEGAFFGFFAEVFGPFGAVEAQSGGG